MTILYLASSRERGRAELKTVQLVADGDGTVMHPDGTKVGILCTTAAEVAANRAPVFVVLDLDAFDLAPIALGRAEAAKEALYG